MERAQSTLDYLILTGIILTVALVLVGIVSNQLTNVTNISKNTQNISLVSNQLGITDAIIGEDGKGIIILQNNNFEAITLQNIFIDSDQNLSFEGVKVFNGEPKTLLLNEITPCEGTQTKNVLLKINYTSSEGLNKTADYGNVVFDCVQKTTPIGNFTNNFFCGDKICKSPDENIYTCPNDCTDTANIAQRVLCVYNNNSDISTQICDYYLQKRAGAHKLGLDINEGMFNPIGTQEFWNGTHLLENMNKPNFDSYVRTPIYDYVNSHPELDIRFLAISKDLPIKVSPPAASDVYFSAATYLAIDLNSAGTFDDAWRIIILGSPDANCILDYLHFDPTMCITNASKTKYRFAVTHLNAYTLDDVKMLIDKAQAPTPNLNESIWVNDLGYNETLPTNYDSNGFITSLLAEGIAKENITYHSSNWTNYLTSTPVVGYVGHGVHRPGYSYLWTYNNVSMPVTNRAIISVFESWYGVSLNKIREKTTDQGLLAQAFTPTAFGGTNYSRSMSGGVAPVYEPGYGGIVPKETFSAAYASGKTFAESFQIATIMRPMNFAVGDPIMMIKEYSDKRHTYNKCTRNNDCESGYCREDLMGVKRCHSTQTICINNNKEVANGKGTCFYNGSKSIPTNCTNGKWEFIECNNTCSVNPSGEAYCGLNEGDSCTNDIECGSGKCSTNLFGVKSCNGMTNSCVYDLGYYVYNNLYSCKDQKTRVQCVNQEWTNYQTCENECYRGRCDVNYSSDKITILNGIYNPIILPKIPIKNDINSILKDYNRYIGYVFLNDTHIAFRKNLLGQNGIDKNIIPGQGFLLNINNGGNDTIIDINGTDFNSTQTIDSNGKYHLIGIPYCKNYAASDVLNEISAITPQCKLVSQYNVNLQPPKWFMTQIDVNLQNALLLKDKYKEDFNIHPNESFLVSCTETVHLLWTPACDK